MRKTGRRSGSACRRGVGSILFIAGACVLSGAAYAEIPPAEEVNNRVEADVYARYLPSRRVEAQPGKVTVVDEGSTFSCEFKAGGVLPVKFSLGERYIGIKNNSPVDLPAHLTAVTTDIETTFPLSGLDKTFVRFGAGPSFFGEDWNVSASSLRIPFRAVLIYRPDQAWTWLAGVAVCPGFERKAISLFGVIFKPNDTWTFHLVPDRPRILYRLTGRMKLFVEGGGSFGEYEVTKDNLKNVVLQYKEFHLGGGIKYKINEYFESSCSIGEMFNRRFQYRDSLGKVGVKDGLYTEVRLEARF